MNKQDSNWEAMQKALSQMWLQRLTAYYRGEMVLKSSQARMFKDMRSVAAANDSHIGHTPGEQ